jgi:hypothetical protein
MSDIIGDVNDPDVTSVPPSGIQNVSASAPSAGSIIGDVNDDDVQSQAEHYGTLTQQAATAAESGASTVSFGLSRGAESLAGKALGINELSPEAQEARQRENPLSSIAGSGAAFATGIGAAGAIGAAGSVAGATGSMLGLGDVAVGALKYGIEGALLQGENEVGKLVTGDPNNLGTAAINMGLSGLIGGGIGAATGGVSSLWAARYGDKVRSALDTASDAIGDAQANPQIPGATGLKPNSDEISGALQRLRIEPTPGVLSSEPFIQNMEGNLAERPSFAGVALNKERQAMFQTLSAVSESTLSDASTQSQAQVGAANKADIKKVLLENLAPIEEGYEQAEPDFQATEVTPEMKAQAIEPIINHDYVKIDPDSAKLADNLSAQINSIDNVSDLKKVRTLISAQLREAYGSGRGEGPLAQILQTAKNSLTSMRDVALKSAAASGDISSDALENIQSLDAQYSAFQNTVKQLGVEGGLGKANNARALLSRFDDLSDESFVKKVFDPNDARNQQFFKQNFPDSFERSRRYQLSQIEENSIDHAQGANGKFSTPKFLSQVRELDPEAQSNMFSPEDLQRIKDVETVHQAIPGTQNKSATSYATAFSHVLSLEGIAQNLTDTAQYAWLKSLPHLTEAAELTGGDEASKLGATLYAANSEKGANPTAFKSMVDYIRATIKGNTALSRGISNFFEGTKEVLPAHLIPDQSSRDNLQKSLDYASNPENVINNTGGMGYYIQSHATARGQTAAAATNYFNSMKPTQAVNSPLDNPPPVDKVQLAKYNRQLDIAQQPLLVLQHAKDGTLQSQDVQTLKTVYPAFHDYMVKKLTDGLIDYKSKGNSVPYHQRVSMNLLMNGSPLDSTMTPMAAQAIMGSASPLQMQNSQATQSGSKKGGASKATLAQMDKVSSLYQTPLQARAADKKS